MAALTADRNTAMKDGELIAVPAAAAKKFFAGALAAADASGFATPGAVATTLTALGRVEEFVDNTLGANGAATVLIRRKKAFKFANKAGDLVTQALMGKSCYIEDDQTVRATATGASVAGKVLAVESDGVWVEI